MPWSHAQMLYLHQTLAWCSIILFAIRGLIFQLHTRWVPDFRWSVVALVVNILLVVSGLCLWGLLHDDPRYDHWLLAKLIAVSAYGLLAHWSMREGPFSIPVYLGALCMLSYAMLVSMTHNVLLAF